MGYIGYKLFLPLYIVLELSTHCIEAAGKLGNFVRTFYFNWSKNSIGIVFAAAANLLMGFVSLDAI